MVNDLGDGIFTFVHEPAEGRDVLIVTQRGAIVVDAGNEPADGRQIVEFMSERGLAPAFLILTHGHGDHIFGFPAFGSIDVIASVQCSEVIGEQRELFERRFGRPTVAGDLPEPTISVEGRLLIDCYDCTLELFPTPGHSRDSLCVYVPERKTLLCGDTVVTAIPVAINNGDGRELEQSVHRVAQHDAELLVAGHGRPIWGRRDIADWLEFQRSYLHEIRDRVRAVCSAAKRSGANLEAETLRATPFEELIGDRLPRAQYEMEQRHENVVKKILQEEF